MVKPGYKHTEIGVLPEDWDVVSLLDEADLLNGLTYTPSNVRDYGLLVMRSSNVQNGRFAFDDNVYVNCEVEDSKLIKKGDILICVRNGSAALIGKCAKADRDYNATFGAFMAVLRGANNDYIHQLLQQGVIQRHIAKNSDSTINQITNGDFKQMVVPFPKSQAERATISTVLSDIDTLIVNLEKLIAKKKAIKQGTMQELLTGKRRLPGFDKEWTNLRLKELCDIEMGQSPDSRYYSSSEGVPLVQGNADIENRQTIIRFYTKSITKKAAKGDIIFTVRAPVGNVAYAMFDCCIGRGVCALQSGSDFLYHLLVFKQDMWSKVSSGSTFDSINSDTLCNTMFFVPADEKEQSTIARILTDMDEEIKILGNRLIKTKNIKAGMMSELLTGRIRLIDKEDA